MKVLVTGATGFVGTHLAEHLGAQGHGVERVSRRPGVGYDWSEAGLREGLAGCEAIVHLAGAGILDRRWTRSYREEILASRVETTTRLARACAEVGGRRLVSASAVGFYGPRDMTELDEEAPAGDDFLARVCRQWEEALAPAREGGIPTAVVRLGVVLGPDGGALERMLTPFRLGLGGPLGSGRQPFPWIHVADLCRLVTFLLEHGGLTGPFNGTAPGGVDQRTFARALGRALGRPALVPTPGLALRLLLGGVSEVLLTGQRPVPRRALEAGFSFLFPELGAALEDLVGNRPA